MTGSVEAIRARLAVDPAYAVRVAVEDNYEAIAERYAQRMRTPAPLSVTGLADRLVSMWDAGRRGQVEDICRVPYQGHQVSPEVDQAVQMIRDDATSNPDGIPKGWVDDLVGMVVTVVETGALNGNAEAEALARQQAAQRQGLALAKQRNAWIAGAVVLALVAVYFFKVRQ